MFVLFMCHRFEVQRYYSIASALTMLAEGRQYCDLVEMRKPHLVDPDWTEPPQGNLINYPAVCAWTVAVCVKTVPADTEENSKLLKLIQSLFINKTQYDTVKANTLLRELFYISKSSSQQFLSTSKMTIICWNRLDFICILEINLSNTS